MQRVILILLVAASASSDKRLPAGFDNCAHAVDGKLDVDASLGEWRLSQEIGSPTPTISFKFSKKTPEDIAEYRRQHANTTTVGAAEVDWSRVTLYCVVTNLGENHTYVLEVLNTDGLVRFVPIDDTLRARKGIIRPKYVYIQNVRDTLMVHSCGTKMLYVMYKRLQSLTDELCNDFSVNAIFDPNISLGEWVAPGEELEIIAKTPEEIAAYRLELKETPVESLSINWNRVNLFGNLTIFSSYGRGSPITFLVELVDNAGAGRMIPVGNSLTLALRSSRFVVPYIRIKNVGKMLGMMICPTKRPRYFSRRQKLFQISEGLK